MNNKETKESRQIREFEWYEVETRVREIMSELLQPFNKKQTEDTIKINEIKRAQAAVLKKLEDHDFLLERDNAQKPTYIQLQDDAIASVAVAVKQTHLQTDTSIARMEAVVAVYEEKIKQLNELERRVDREVLERVEEFGRLRGGLEKEMGLLGKRQDQQVEEVSQFKNSTKSAVSRMETRMIAFDNRLKELEDNHRHTHSDLRRLLEDGVSGNERTGKLESLVADLGTRVEDREKDTKLSEKFLGKVREMEGELRFLSTFLEQYQPLYTQMILADTLNSFVEGRQRRKLCIYEEKQFAKLHRHILLNDKLTLEDMMGSYSNQIRKAVSRNKKYVINLAVAESVRHGSNLYEFRVDHLADIDEGDEGRKVAAVVDPMEILRVVDSRLEGIEGQVKGWVDHELRPTKAWIAELQEQMLMRALEYDEKYREVRRAGEEVSARVELEKNHNQNQLREVGKQQEQAQLALVSVRQHLRDILNFSSVMNHIVIQDEIDRQGTALYALNSHKQESLPSPAFQLDPNCLSCENKNTQFLQQAFKMACLTYNPSQIRIDNQLFTREEILQISTGILEQLKKKVLGREDSGSKQLDTGLLHRKDPRGRTSSKGHSGSGVRQGRVTTREGRELQTLLPVVGPRTDRRDRKSQLSVFY